MFLHEIDEEIALKLLDANDAEEIFQLTDSCRNYLREWLPWVDQTNTVDDSKSFIEFTLKTYAEKKAMTTGILYKGNLVGVASFNSFDWTNKVGYIGYWMNEDYQGHGIMTRATRALTDYAFHELKLNRVDIRAAYENKKSKAIPERLGFVKEGKIRQAEWLYDHYVDHVVYGMLASEWEQN